ncbi:hypothetical protein [Litoribrevibacter albus]|uniref:Uncharacterized protein n=1 Tax=Litoribrevibacter albus TaxID=1473156 RepID=A0AA37SCA9_9GAMM|nr:hypothetical protein [Litoribrevibacter albus]GLQ32016.1 hypothetical protein GCM10007876_24950 [Litoribrevibacter albus]
MTKRKPLSKDDIDLSALYQQGANELPPEHLDQAVLSLANEILAKDMQAKEGQVNETPASPETEGPLKVKISPWRRWQWPLSAAAVVVISSSIILDLHQQQKLDVEFAPAPSPSIIQEYREMPSDDLPMEEKSGTGYSIESFQAEPIQAEPIQVEPIQAEPSQFQSRQIDEVQMNAIDSFEMDSAGSEMAEETQIIESVESESVKPAMKLKSSEGVLPAVPAMRLPAIEPSSISEQELPALQDQQPAAVQMMDVDRKEETPSLQRQKKQQRDLKTKPEIPSPQAWLASIDSLIENGKLSEAEQELLEFRKHYPEVELPARLKALLGEESQQ